MDKLEGLKKNTTDDFISDIKDVPVLSFDEELLSDFDEHSLLGDYEEDLDESIVSDKIDLAYDRLAEEEIVDEAKDDFSLIDNYNTHDMITSDDDSVDSIVSSIEEELNMELGVVVDVVTEEPDSKNETEAPAISNIALESHTIEDIDKKDVGVKEDTGDIIIVEDDTDDIVEDVFSNFVYSKGVNNMDTEDNEIKWVNVSLSDVVDKELDSGIVDDDIGVDIVDKELDSGIVDDDIGVDIVDKELDSGIVDDDIGVDIVDKELDSGIVDDDIGVDIVDKELDSGIVDDDIDVDIVDKELDSGTVDDDIDVDIVDKELDSGTVDDDVNVDVVDNIKSSKGDGYIPDVVDKEDKIMLDDESDIQKSTFNKEKDKESKMYSDEVKADNNISEEALEYSSSQGDSNEPLVKNIVMGTVDEDLSESEVSDTEDEVIVLEDDILLSIDESILEEVEKTSVTPIQENDDVQLEDDTGVESEFLIDEHPEDEEYDKESGFDNVIVNKDDVSVDEEVTKAEKLLEDKVLSAANGIEVEEEEVVSINDIEKTDNIEKDELDVYSKGHDRLDVKADRSNLIENKKEDIKEVLKYIDSLFGDLPNEKIEEFAKSKYYTLYNKLFKDLGI